MNTVNLAVGVTFGFVVLGVLGKALAHGWRWSDFYLGMQMTLAAISGSVVYCFELSRELREDAPKSLSTDELSRIIESNQIFLLVALICYFVIALLHRSWENDRAQPCLESIFLIGIANAMGAVLLASFILYVKAH